MENRWLLLVGVVMGIALYKILQKVKRKIAIKNIKEQLYNLKTIAMLTDDHNERVKSIELAAKLGEKLNELEKEG